MAEDDAPHEALRAAYDALRIKAAVLEDREAALGDRLDFLELIFQGDRLAAYDWRLPEHEIIFDAHIVPLLGVAPGEVRQVERFRDLLHPEDEATVRAAFEDYLAGRAPLFDVECRLRHRNGSWVWVRDRCRLVARDADGRPLRVRGALRDISARKEVEQALRESEERYRHITEAVTDYIYTVRIEDGRAVETRHGPGCIAVTGYASEEFAADPLLWHRMVVEADRGAVENQARRLLAGENAPPLEHRLVRKDGSVRWVRNTSVLHRDALGRYIAYDGLIQDITERKRAEEALRESEERYRSFVRNFQGIAYRGRIDFTPIFFHGAVEALTGYTEEEFLAGRPRWDQVIHPDDRSSLRESFEAVATRPGYAADREYRVLRKDGGVRWVHEVISNHPAGQEGEAFVEGAIYDITERKQAERALRESEEMYRTLAETSIDMIFLVDAEGRLLYVNSGSARQFGSTPENLVGRRLAEIFRSEIAERHLSVIREVIRTGAPRHNELLEQFPTGNVWIDAHLSPVRNREGEIVAVQGVSRDISEHKQAEERLATERERLAVTLRSIGDGVIATDTEGRILIVNRAAEELTGWSQAAALGRPLGEVFSVIDSLTRQRVESPVESVLGTGHLVGHTSGRTLVARDGAERAIAESAAPIRDTHSRIIGVVLVFRDVTEKEKLEQALRQAQKLESIALLAGGIAHDFNNILTGVLGNVSLAKHYVGSDGKAFERLSEAERAALRAKDLTQQLLTFSKGGAPIRRPAHLAPLVREAVVFASRGSNVGVEFAPERELWPAEVDAGQINQALNNIVLNAIQAMPMGGTLRVGAENVSVEEHNTLALSPGQYVKISVADTGIGIPESLLDRIFDPFFTTKQTGSGLGLATTYSIVKAHEGHVTVESQLGVGSTFALYLPATSKPVYEGEETAAGAPHGPARILVMDDEVLVRDLASEILASNGFTAECVSNGQETVERFQRARGEGRPFDAVIMDLTVVGGMGGLETLARLREIDPWVKAVVSSGYSNDPVMASYREHGFSAVLVKPYTVTALLSALHEALSPAPDRDA